jgi:hypothetical protein
MLSEVEMVETSDATAALGSDELRLNTGIWSVVIGPEVFGPARPASEVCKAAL